MKYRNTNRQGGRFSAVIIDSVWDKGFIVERYDPHQLRQDACGSWMKKLDYGNVGSQWGWEVDHIYPASLGGSDSLDNLQPLQWENNRSKGDNFPNWQCAV